MSKRIFCIAATAFSLLTASASHAQTLALDISQGGVEGSVDGSLGWSFATSEPIRVTELGIWDYASDGLTDDHQVAIWTIDGGSQLALTTVPSGDATTLVSSATPDGGWRFVAITPVILPAGSYVIGAHYPSQWDTSRMSVGGFSPVVVSTASVITYGMDRLTSQSDISQFYFPELELGIQRPAYFGPNLRFDGAVTVPEASTFALALPTLGMVGVVVIKRRRK